MAGEEFVQIIISRTPRLVLFAANLDTANLFLMESDHLPVVFSNTLFKVFSVQEMKVHYLIANMKSIHKILIAEEILMHKSHANKMYIMKMLEL